MLVFLYLLNNCFKHDLRHFLLLVCLAYCIFWVYAESVKGQLPNINGSDVKMVVILATSFN